LLCFLMLGWLACTSANVWMGLWVRMEFKELPRWSKHANR